MRILVFAALGSLLVAGASSCAAPPSAAPAAQDAAYALTPGVTLRYRKQSEWTTTSGLSGMMERDRSRYRRDSRFAITFSGEGRARASIESSRLVETPAEGGDATVRTAGPDVVGLPFVLALGPRGSDSLVSWPSFPQEWADMASQFNGFFPKLPGGPLTPGREWTDSWSDERGDTSIVTRTSHYTLYRVEGTERIRGTDVVVVRYVTRSTTERRWRNPLPGIDPYLMPQVMSHRDAEVNGTFYFAPRSGRLVRHTYTAETSISRPSGHVEAFVDEITSHVTIDLEP